MKQIVITALVVIGIIVGAIILSGGDDNTAGSESNNFYGTEQGVITVTEYGDFQCPACLGFFPIVGQVKEQFKDQIRFEYKHFPLVQIHTNATTAHRAAQAAANQGKFWEMHDLLFERQQSWSESTNPTAIFEEYARELELNFEQFQADAASSDTLAIINADIAAGKALGSTGTPTFYIDDVRLEDLTTISTPAGFAAVIQQAIDAKEGSQSPADTTESPEEVAKPEEVDTE